MGRRVEGFGFTVYVWGLWHRVQDLGFGAKGAGLRVYVLRFFVWWGGLYFASHPSGRVAALPPDEAATPCPDALSKCLLFDALFAWLLFDVRSGWLFFGARAGWLLFDALSKLLLFDVLSN